MNTETKIGITPCIGTVLHGTHRAEDIIPVFLSQLEYYNPTRATELNLELIECGFDCEHGHAVIGEDREGWPKAFTPEIEGDFIADLFDALNEVAPPYCYFGSNEGDGSDFGFWPVDFEDIKEDVEFVSSREQEYPGADYRGFWLHVNDHGNVTLFDRLGNDDDVERWSIV